MKNRGQRSWSVGLSIADITNSILTDRKKTHAVSTLAQVQPHSDCVWSECNRRVRTRFRLSHRVPRPRWPRRPRTCTVLGLNHWDLPCRCWVKADCCVHCRAGVALVRRSSWACRASWDLTAPPVTPAFHWGRRKTPNWGKASLPSPTSWVRSGYEKRGCGRSDGL